VTKTNNQKIHIVIIIIIIIYVLKVSSWKKMLM